jgi:hypothetical protein
VQVHGEVTGNDTVEMSWNNYKEKIVNTHQVILDNWPSDIFNPSEMDTAALEKVMKVLEEGDCKGHQLTDEVFASHKAGIVADKVPSKKWKQCSDKGMKRGQYKKPIAHKSAHPSLTSSSNDSNRGDTCGNMQPVSAETIAIMKVLHNGNACR